MKTSILTSIIPQIYLRLRDDSPRIGSCSGSPHWSNSLGFLQGHVQKRACRPLPKLMYIKIGNIYIYILYIISYIHIYTYTYIYILSILSIYIYIYWPWQIFQMLSWSHEIPDQRRRYRFPGTASKHFPPTATSGTCEDWPRWALAAINYRTIYICIYI